MKIMLQMIQKILLKKLENLRDKEEIQIKTSENKKENIKKLTIDIQEIEIFNEGKGSRQSIFSGDTPTFGKINQKENSIYIT